MQRDDSKPDEQGKQYAPYKKFIGAVVPNWLMKRPDISQGAKLCFARLAQYAGKSDHCYPKRDTLAVELGVSVPTVRNYLGELVGRGLIKSVRRGGTKENLYIFIAADCVEFKPSDLQKSISHPSRVIDRKLSSDLQKFASDASVKRITEENQHRETLRDLPDKKIFVRAARPSFYSKTSTALVMSPDEQRIRRRARTISGADA